MPAAIHSLDDDERRNALGIRGRRQFIDDTLTWRGTIRNGELVEAFGISKQQAAQDLRAFRDLRPGQVAYDAGTKLWSATPSYEPTSGSLEDTFRRRPDLRAFLGFCTVSTIGTAWPVAKMDVLRTLVMARRQRKPVAVTYQSLTPGSEAPKARSICPHAFFEDWAIGYVRAYCYLRGDFRDFRIERFLKAEPCPRTSWMTDMRDADWRETIGIRLEPHPDLPPEQQVSCMEELGLPTFGGTLDVRRSHLFYVLRRLGILEAIQEGHGRAEVSKRYVCTNPAALQPHLPKLAGSGAPEGARLTA